MRGPRSIWKIVRPNQWIELLSEKEFECWSLIFFISLELSLSLFTTSHVVYCVLHPPRLESCFINSCFGHESCFTPPVLSWFLHLSHLSLAPVANKRGNYPSRTLCSLTLSHDNTQSHAPFISLWDVSHAPYFVLSWVMNLSYFGLAPVISNRVILPLGSCIPSHWVML